MKTLRKKITLIVVFALFISCDNNHKTEFYRIQRDDIAGYQDFIRKYPKSIYIKDAKERIEAAKEAIRQREEKERKEAELRRLEELYGNNQLPNGAQPYSKWYGKNSFYDEYTPHLKLGLKPLQIPMS